MCEWIGCLGGCIKGLMRAFVVELVQEMVLGMEREVFCYKIYWKVPTFHAFLAMTVASSVESSFLFNRNTYESPFGEDLPCITKDRGSVTLSPNLQGLIHTARPTRH